MWRRLKLDRNQFLVRFDVIPFPVRVPTLRNHLNQDFSLWNRRSFRGTVLIRFQIELSQLIMVQQSARRIETDVDARVRDGIVPAVGYDDS